MNKTLKIAMMIAMIIATLFTFSNEFTISKTL